ncbi:CapA family protein [Phytoactinopolyspora halotolerans]|uniref:acylphosphatase n=1 Tax=Phytoactinopolyspora halotolerans TaxID=1981512 RepID=A0A6L9SFR6_9ACTN|nr:CapA family protein [Phytoactinopolyspora halotolerans]NEE04096.1 ATP-grasp domain-containing protein [Phytoactinopolyspora halotolerans]
MRLRADDETTAPAEVVAHVQGTIGDGAPVSVFGRVEWQSPRDDGHFTANAWAVTESLAERLVGGMLSLDDADTVGHLMRPVLADLNAVVKAEAEAERVAARLPRRALRTRARRSARYLLNLARRRPGAIQPERRVARLLGAEAVQTALTGMLRAASGETHGRSGAGGWFTGDLADFYEQHIARVNRYICVPAPAPPSMDGKAANTFEDVDVIGLLPKDGTKGHLLEREALRYGLDSLRFPNGTFLVSDDQGHQLNFKWGRSPIASGVSLSICSYKEATRRLLAKLDVPVPRGGVFSIDDVEKALDYADRIGYPVVCKPVAGLRGIGVVTNIRSRDELQAALELYTRSQLGNDDFVIEQYVRGSDYRIVVIGDDVVAAVLREPAAVVGDGAHTIADLVEYKNRVRALNPHLRSRRIQFSDAMRYQLAQANLSLGSVPAAGQKVVLANSANLSQGGDSFEVVHELHPSIREVALRAVRAIPGLGFCGLDMLLEDHRKPIDQQSATVIELNAHAAIGSAQYPMWGTPTPVAKLFFEECAREHGITLPAVRSDRLSVQVVVKGKVTKVSFRRWFRRRAVRFGVAGQIQNTARKEVTVHLDGPADAVAALVYLAILGPRKSGPTSVTTTHVPAFEGTGFRIVRRSRTGFSRKLLQNRLARRTLARLRRRLAITGKGTAPQARPNVDAAPITSKPTKDWRVEQPRSRFDVVFAGDTGFGENYQEEEERRGRGNVLKEHGYAYSFERVAPLLAGADVVVANLETPLTRLTHSPFEGIRPWLHRSDPIRGPQTLLSQNIGVVSLANNHTADYGEQGLLDTLRALDDHGIVAIGAGRDAQEAGAPFRARVRLTGADGSPVERQRLRVYSVFHGGRQFRDELKAYATPEQPGSAQLVVSSLAARIQRVKQRRPDEFVVVCPHWRRDYQWRSDRQARTAAQLVEAGADLVLGHGSHMLQEIEKVSGTWVVHGIGNFVFNSRGRYGKLGAPPYSLVARLTLSHGERTLRLYPIVTDNRRTGYQSRPVTAAEFTEVHTLLADRTNAPDDFRREFRAAEDDRGRYLEVRIEPADGREDGHRSGTVPINRRRTEGRHRPGATDRDDAGAAFGDGAGLDRRRDVSTQLIARELQRRGHAVTWLTRNYIVSDDGNGTRFGYIATDSHLTGAAGVRAARRKDVTRRLVADAGLAIARGAVFDPEHGQADAARLARELGRVVVKPVDGNMGRGVTVGVHGSAASEFGQAWREAAAITRRGVLVEEHVDGTEGRFLVVGGRCIAAIKRVAPYVVGNGQDSIEELIRQKNAERAQNPNLHKRLIQVDDHRMGVLREQGYDLAAIPAAGVRVALDLKGNISTGAESVDITDDVHPSFLDVAGRAAAAFPGLDVAGVDLIAHDFSQPATDGNYIVCEMNNRPGIGSHHFPVHGEPRDVAAAIVDLHINTARRDHTAPATVQTVTAQPATAQPATAQTADRPPRPQPAAPPVDGTGPTAGAGSAVPARPVSHLLETELVRRGFAVTRLTPDLLVADRDGERVAFSGTLSHRTGRAALKAASRPHLSRRLLAEAGLETAPEEADGDGTRFLVVGDECVAVSGDDEARGAVDLTDRADAGFARTAVRAVAAFPGLDVAEVVIAAHDISAPAAPGNHAVVTVDTRPDLVRYHRPAQGRARDVAAAIVDLHVHR